MCLCMSGVAFALSGAASSVNVEGGFVRNDAHSEETCASQTMRLNHLCERLENEGGLDKDVAAHCGLWPRAASAKADTKTQL